MLIYQRVNHDILGEPYIQTHRFKRAVWAMWAETLIDSSRTGKLTTIYVYGYPLVNIQKTIENHHWNSGISHWKWWFSIAMLNYQRVKFMKQKSWQPGFTARKKQPQKKSHIVHRCPCPNIFTTHLPWTKTLSWWQFQWSHRNIATEPDKLTTAGNTYQMLPLYIPRDISISIHILYIYIFIVIFIITIITIIIIIYSHTFL